jgi:hypothetical protein
MQADSEPPVQESGEFAVLPLLVVLATLVLLVLPLGASVPFAVVEFLTVITGRGGQIKVQLLQQAWPSRE